MEIYEPLNKSLQHVGALMDAAEAHGMLCGMLCIPQFFSETVWFQYVLSHVTCEDGLAAECQRQLELIKNYTVEKLNSPLYEFEPLLPPDEMSLPSRVQALAGWCEGFSFGLGIGGIQNQTLSLDAEEFIRDALAISRIAPIEQETNDAEANYTQLVEYIRVGVATLYEELMLVEG